jgi:hypothetical protein
MDVTPDGTVGIREVYLSVPDDLDGSAADLRGFLLSAGPHMPWQLGPQAPSAGQGLAESIGLVLDSAAAGVALWDRCRLWLKQRRQHETRVMVTATIELDGQLYKMIVSLDPVEAGDERPA